MLYFSWSSCACLYVLVFVIVYLAVGIVWVGELSVWCVRGEFRCSYMYDVGGLLCFFEGRVAI